MDLMDLASRDRQSLSHDELYDRIIDELGGPGVLRPYLPFESIDDLRDAYLADHDLNNLPDRTRYLSAWDAAAGFKIAPLPIQPPTYVPSGTGLWPLLKRHGVTWMTPSQGVCLLKRAAVRVLASEKPASPPRHTDEAVIIQPYQDLLAGHGEIGEMRHKLEILKSVDPCTMYILVPFALGRPGGLSEEQARKLVDALSEGPDKEPGIVSKFYEHLCFDDDVRPWIDSLDTQKERK